MNARLIARRRLELQVSRAELARVTGLSWDLLTALEEKSEPPLLTLDAARRLASALAVGLDAIASSSETAIPDADDVRLERLLARASQPVSPTALAKALKWPLPRLVEASQRLEHRLSGTGQALQRQAGHLRLTARGSGDATGDLGRLRLPVTRLSKRQAELLRIATVGTASQRRWENFDNEQRSDAAQLCELGLIEPVGAELRLSQDAAFCVRPGVFRIQRRVASGNWSTNRADPAFGGAPVDQPGLDADPLEVADEEAFADVLARPTDPASHLLSDDASIDGPADELERPARR